MVSYFYELTRNHFFAIVAALCVTLSCTRKQENDIKITYDQRIEQLANECFKEYADVPLISPNEFSIQSKATQNKAAQNKPAKWIIVDVRSQRERDISIIPDALSINEFEAQWDLFKKVTVMVYCTAGCRSVSYARMLNENGFKAFNLYGGILAWALEGLTFVTPNEKVTNQVHVYGKKWNALPPGYESVIGQ